MKEMSKVEQINPGNQHQPLSALRRVLVIRNTVICFWARHMPPLYQNINGGSKFY